MSYPDLIITETVTIAAGASLSGASTYRPGYSLVGIQTASTWDAAKITLDGSLNGTNYFSVRTNAAEYEIASITGAACVAIDPAVTHMWKTFKVRSGIVGTLVAQVDATIVTLVFKVVGV